MIPPRRARAPCVIATIALVVTSSLGTASPASAIDEAPRLGLTPVAHDGPFFELVMDAGEERSLQVEVANFGAGEVVARTYAADVYSIINGGFGAGLFGEPPNSTTSWLSYPGQEATLGTREAVVIDFDVAVPAATPPGEYITALAVENVEPFRGSGPVTIDQINRNAIAVAIDVPGHRRPELEIGGVNYHAAGEQSVVTFGIDNPGNMHLRPAGEFQLLDDAGRQLGSGPLSMDTVYAGTSTSLEAPLAQLLPEGDYCAELRLADAVTGVADETECLGFSVTPAPVPGDDPSVPGPGAIALTLPSTDVLIGAAPAIGAGLLGLLLGGIAILVLVRRRRRRRAGA